MIVQKEILEKLKDFGLNSYEVKIWTALLSRGVSTAGELSDIANVPRSRSYDVLESLEKKGFVIMKLGKPIKYIAVPPREVIERVKKRINDDAEFRQKMLKDIEKSEIVEELTLLHNQGVDLVEPADLSGAIRGRENIYNHMELMINSASESIIIVTTKKGLERKIRSLKKALAKAQKRGVEIKIVAPSTTEKETLEDLKDIAEVRTTKDIRARLMIIDAKEIAFMLLDDEEVHPAYDTGIWVNTPFFTNALVSLFDMAWQSMEKIKN